MKTFKKILSKTQKGFTLVELIIVITILAILGTIAFSSYRGIVESARDSNRLATLKELEKGLDLYKAKTGNYPMPEGQIHTGVLSLSGNEIDYSYMGIVGENISSQLKLNSIPLDPLSGTNYIYATNINRTKFQIATVFERLEAYKKPGQNMKSPGQNMKFNIFDKQELCLIQETYANDSSYKAKVLGNHKTEVKIENGGKIWLTTVPSMIFDSSSIQGTTLSGYILNSSGSYLIVNKGKNLPYKLSASDTTANENGDKVMELIRENTKAKIVSIDITEIENASNSSDRIAKITEKFGTGGTNEVLPGIKSNEILSSFGVKEEDLANTSAITSKMETIITGQTSTSTNTTSQNNTTCTSWTYSTGACESNSTAPLTIVTRLPSGCSGGTPLTTTSCSYNIYSSCSTGGEIKYVISGVVGITDVGLTCNDDIIVCSGNQTGYTLKACNVGATTVYTNQTFATTTTPRDSTINSWAGGLYQWGNNEDISISSTSSTRPTCSTGSTFSANTFITGNADWCSSQTDDVWGNTTNTNESRKGPCPNNYHVPTSTEWTNIVTAGGWSSASWTDDGTRISNALKLPFAGGRTRNAIKLSKK